MQKKVDTLSIFSYWAIASSTLKVIQAFTFHLSHLQLIAILIQIQASVIFSAQKDPFSTFTTKLADILALNSFFQDNYDSWIHSLAVVCTWVYLTLIIGSLIFIGIQNFYRNKTETRLGGFIACVMQLHYGVVFWITTRILMIPWMMKAQEINTITPLNISNNTLALINLPFLVMTCLMGGIASIMCVDYLKSDNRFAVIKPSDQCFSFLLKIIFVMCLPLKSEDQTSYTILLVIALLMSLLRHYLLLRTVPYQSYQTMKLSLIWSCSESYLLAINAITSIVGNSTSDKSFTIFYGALLILPWIVKYNIVFFDKSLEKYLTAPIESLKTENQVYKKVLSWQKLIEPLNRSNTEDNFSTKSRLYFLGLLNDHLTVCKKQKCYCNSIKKSDLSKLTQEKGFFEKCIKMLFYNLLEESVQRIKESQNLRLGLVNEVLNSPNNEIIKIFSSLNAIPKESSFIVKVKRNILLLKLQVKLETGISQLEEGTLNIKQVIDFHNEKRLCTDLLASNTRKFIDFWSYYTQPNFRLVELLKKSIAIEKEADKIDKLFQSYMSKYPELTHILGEDYYAYLTLIRNRPTAAMKFREKHLWRKKHEKSLDDPLATFSDLMTSGSTILYVSMSKGKKGKIVYASFDGSKDALNYEKKDLLSNDMNILLLPSLREKHFHLMNDPLQLAETDNIKVHELESYVINKDGFVTPCFIYVAIFPRLQEELTYACILSPKKHKIPFIIFNEEGLMQGMSKGINEKSDFSPQKRIYMKEICSFDDKESEWQKLANFSQRFEDTTSEKRRVCTYEGQVSRQTIMNEQFLILQIKQNLKAHNKQNLMLPTDPDASDFQDIPDESPDRAKIMNQNSNVLSATERKGTRLRIKDLPTSPRKDDIITMFSERSEKGVMLKESLETESFAEIFSDRKTKTKNTFSSSKNASIGPDLKSQLEYGAYKIPSKRLMRSINVVVAAVLIMCITLLFVCGQIIHNRLVFIHQNSQILNVATIRLQLMVQLGRNIIYRNFLNEGLIKNDRYLQVFGIPDFKNTYPSPQFREQTLNQQNTLLRRLFDQIDENLQEDAYSYMVPLIDENSQILYKNIFDAVIELTLKAKKLTADPNQLNQANNSNIMFIIRNSFNEILIGSERVSDIVLKDSMQNLDQLTYLMLYLLTGISILGVMLLFLLIQRQSRLTDERTKVISLFLMIRDQDIQHILSQAIQFEQTLTLSEIKAEKSSTKNNFLPNNDSAKLSHHYQKKTASKDRLNLGHFMITLLGFILCVTMTLPFLINYLLIKNKISFFKNKLEAVVNMNTHPYEMQLLHSSLCSYIDPNGLTQLRTRPFEEEWEAIFQRRSNVNTVFYDLLLTLENENVCSKSTIQSISQIMTGDVCDPFAAGFPAYQCTTMAGGASLRGVLGMASYSMSALRDLKGLFDNSNKTNAARTEILDSVENCYVESTVTGWHVLAINQTTTLMLDCSNSELNKMQGNLDIYWALYILAYIFIAIIVSRLWSRIIDRESAGWKKLIRKIPLEIILTHNALKVYVQKEWNKISKSS